MEGKKKEVLGLSLLFLFSFLTAGFIAALLILNYGPTGRYSGKNTILAPDTLSQLNYQDSKSGSPFKYLFEKIEFTAFGKRVDVDTKTYSEFYRMIANDESLDVNQTLFNKPAATLTLYTKPEKVIRGEEASHPFQQIDFSEDGNHYRVELIGNSGWAAFKHDGILKKTLKLFKL